MDGAATRSDTIIEIHRRFCEKLPDNLLWVENPDSGERVRVVPGELRDRDVRVGQHVAISPGAVPLFLTRFEEAYRRLVVRRGSPGTARNLSAGQSRRSYVSDKSSEFEVGISRCISGPVAARALSRALMRSSRVQIWRSKTAGLCG